MHPIFYKCPVSVSYTHLGGSGCSNERKLVMALIKDKVWSIASIWPYAIPLGVGLPTVGDVYKRQILNCLKQDIYKILDAKDLNTAKELRNELINKKYTKDVYKRQALNSLFYWFKNVKLFLEKTDQFINYKNQ